VFAFYGGKKRFGEAMQVKTGRMFIVLFTMVAYVIALRMPQSIFDLATQYAFAGYSALAPLLVAALFWKGSTKWGAFASTLWTAAAVLGVATLQSVVAPPPPDVVVPILSLGGIDVVTRITTGTLVLGLLPVVPMTIISALLMIVVSSQTPGARPGAGTLSKYFSRERHR
jgi:SSS family solute:Na+ symporter